MERSNTNRVISIVVITEALHRLQNGELNHRYYCIYYKNLHTNLYYLSYYISIVWILYFLFYT